MTIKEAVCRLETHKEFYLTNHPNADSLIEALQMAIAALEKQEAKKPKNTRTVAGIVSIGLCPACGEILNDDINYCFVCGQKIDWTEGE